MMLTGKYEKYLDKVLSLDPTTAYQEVVQVGREKATDLTLAIYDAAGKLLLSYTEALPKEEAMPEPAKPIGTPTSLATTEALYLAGRHLEQYRHATYQPEDYYLEGLKRDATDSRLNTAYGSLLLRRGCFKDSEKYLRQAVQTATKHSPNPYDGESYYLLGLSLKYQKRYEEAYAAFYKATWNGAYQHAGYYQVAQLDVLAGDFEEGLKHIDHAILSNYHSIEARHLKSAILRHLGSYEAARAHQEETEKIDPLSVLVEAEYRLLCKAQQVSYTPAKWQTADVHQAELLVARNYLQAGLYADALEGLTSDTPLTTYYRGYCYDQLGQFEEGLACYKKAEHLDPTYCFANDLMDILVLEHVQYVLEGAGMAAYYLANLWYDRKQYAQAVAGWEKCTQCYPTFPTAHRNLALVYFNQYKEPIKARAHLEQAFAYDPTDARVFLERDQLYKKLNVSVPERLAQLEIHKELVERRDDLYVEYITLLNLTGAYEKAKEAMATHKFHPWEGGEGKITKQYVKTQRGLAKACMTQKAYDQAITLLKEALVYPENLGEGKLLGSTDNDIYYDLGQCYRAQGEEAKAQDAFRRATRGIDTPTSALYYNDQPPENIFYQARAYRALGQEKEAVKRFKTLMSYGVKHLNEEMKIDYFAVSLPDFLIFEEDLVKRNKVHCYYLMALANWGLGEEDTASKYFERVKALDCTRIG